MKFINNTYICSQCFSDSGQWNTWNECEVALLKTKKQ